MSVRSTRARLVEQSGITLTELLVVLVILAIVLGGMTTLFVSAATSQADQSNRVEAQQNARVALDALRREIRCATGVTAVSASSLTITLPGYCQKPPVAAAAQFTWCAVGPVSGPWALWRYTGSLCSGSGRRTADRLVSNTIFTYSRPLSFPVGEQPVLTALTTGGTIGPGTYVYTVTDVDAAGKETARARATVTFATGDTNSVRVTWPAKVGSVSYNVYGRDDGSTTLEGLRLLKSNATSPWVDTGAAFESMAAPPLATVGISLLVDASPGDTRQRFSLSDEIVLRNSGRG